MLGAEEPLIRIEGLHYTYQAGTRRAVPALCGIDLTIDAGECVALIGANGSGKSTLLRHLNALLLPTSGRVWVSSWDTREAAHLRQIRSTVGMVFQVPDSQIVATVVEEDVAFGPENLGVPEAELRQRVDWALETVGLTDLQQRASHLLSAGQKQRLAIASVLAMQPRCLVLDEATSMLDPQGRSQLLETIHKLHDAGMAIIAATHNMAEAALAQRIVVLSNGQVVLQGEPHAVFKQVDTLHSLELDVPQVALLAREVAARVPRFAPDALSLPELVDGLSLLLGKAAGVSP